LGSRLRVVPSLPQSSPRCGKTIFGTHTHVVVNFFVGLTFWRVNAEHFSHIVPNVGAYFHAYVVNVPPIRTFGMYQGLHRHVEVWIGYDISGNCS
jgi:hypothetical protein